MVPTREYLHNRVSVSMVSVSESISNYDKNQIVLCTYLDLGVKKLCSKITELCYALILTIYANYAPEICHYAFHFSRLVNRYTSLYNTDRNDQPPLAETVCSPAQHWSCSNSRSPSSPDSSTSSPSLETMVNLVPEAKAASTTIALCCVQLIESCGNCAWAICMGLKK